MQSYARNGIIVVGAADASFAGLLNSALPAAFHEPLQPIARHSLIVRNESAQALCSIVFRLDLTNPAGLGINQKYFDRRPCLTGQSGGGLAPGSVAVFTASPAVNDALRRGDTAPASEVLRDIENQAAMFSTFTVQPSVDSVITAGGQVIGPDKSRTFNRISESWMAVQHLVGELVSRADSAQPQPQVAEWLQRLSMQKVPGRWQNDTLDFFKDEEVRFARLLLQELGAGSVREVAAKFKPMLTQPQGPTLTRVD